MITYSEIGVKEYWVVDLQRNVIVRYLAENSFAPEVISYAGTSKMPVLSYPGLDIELSHIFG